MQRACAIGTSSSRCWRPVCPSRRSRTSRPPASYTFRETRLRRPPDGDIMRNMEAASIRGHRRRGPSWKAPIALALYAGALFIAWTLVTDTHTVEADETPVAPAETGAPVGTDLTLNTHA